MPELSVLIPARNEGFLGRTIEDILKNSVLDTEIIAVLDGYWPTPPIPDHPRVKLIHFTDPVGQRAGTNYAARLSRAPYIMKCDGHCAFDSGFDSKLLAPYKDGTLGQDVTTVPRLYNLHAFDWKCSACGHRTYQGAQPTKCEKCQKEQFEMHVVWEPRLSRKSDFGRIDKELRFQYWRQCGHRLESQSDIADLMCHVGACWLMPTARYWELGGMDEAHGSWGQMGVEVSLKSWLSGGRQVVNKTTWFGHMFRTQPGWSFPYKITNSEVEQARAYSRDFWFNNRWPLQKHPFTWLVDKFKPVPEWHEGIPEPPAMSSQKDRVRRRRRRLPPPPPEPKPPASEFKEEPAEFLFMTVTPRASDLYRRLMEELAKHGMMDKE